ncbi:hypothetical protein CC2G_005137 [Coprinopsis cinerea AmutBmut pab1-1]|nr:hypothetical protein CC2G_005137 [Coprinopsis cinerea AmutBmut pab1-1]
MTRKKNDITHITGKNRVHLMKPVTTVDSRGRIKTKLVPARPSPKKRVSTASASAKVRRRTYESDHSDEEEDTIIPQPPLSGDQDAEIPRTKDSNEYMADWLPKMNIYLDYLVAREAVPDPLSCSYCATGISESWWRCTECLGSPVYCGDCCRLLHFSHPLHRVEELKKGYFSPSWLWRSGVYVNLCAERHCTPTGRPDSSGLLDDEKLNDGDDDIQTDWNVNDDFSFGAKPPKRHVYGMKVLVVVHTNGVHHVPFHTCECLDAPDPEFQLLKMGFYPASSKDVRTVFTFSMLDEYVLETLECFTSTHHYYSKLRRLTNYSFPDTVPDRARELRRVGRQWLRLNDLARHGFSHTQKTPEKGSMALFCAACPQPGINLPDDWEEDTEKWKYTRSFVADGNFTCIHRKQRERDSPEVHLKHGEGYMVSPVEYGKHLATAQETNETPTCHEHRAIADKSKVRKGLDVTGIGAVACMRHGAFAPGSVVDFQKGERQINIDYALSEAIKLSNTDNIKRVIFAYDINCQYSKRALDRLRDGEFLELREDIVFVFGIGLFHVHGHQESCLARYSLSFIEGAGNSAGEILESLWAVVNELARSTSTMTLAHRLEILDALFGDINWKKMLGIGEWNSKLCTF